MKNVRRGLGKGLGTGYKNLAVMDSHIHSLSAKGVRSIYRARGHYKPTNRESYVTTVWRREKEDAEQDIRVFTKHNPDWEKVKIVKEDFDEYIKKHQKLPKLNAKLKQPKIEPLNDYDYDLDEYGCKTVSWSGEEKRNKNLYNIQEFQRPKVIKHLNDLGYKLIKTERENDGWMMGFKQDVFFVKDKRTGEEIKFIGNDDNTAVFKEKDYGKTRAFDIPNTKRWTKFEGEAKGK